MQHVILAEGAGNAFGLLILVVVVFMVLGGITSAIDKLTAPKKTDFEVKGSIHERR